MSLADTHPELFNNPTLGAATTNRFLDEVEAQNKEDRSARVEGREPRTIMAVNRYPQYMPSNSVPSDAQPQLAYVDDLDQDDNGFPVTVVEPEYKAPVAITYSKQPEEVKEEEVSSDPYANYSDENN